MGRVFLCEFDQTVKNCLVYCRKCRAHIALLSDYRRIFMVQKNKTSICGDVFVKAINIFPSNPRIEKRVGDCAVENVSCVKCSTVLGQKFVEVAESDVDFKVGYYLFDLMKTDKLAIRIGLDIINPPSP